MLILFLYNASPPFFHRGTRHHACTCNPTADRLGEKDFPMERYPHDPLSVVLRRQQNGYKRMCKGVCLTPVITFHVTVHSPFGTPTV
uniref:Uncharacterized protein n=1 Tax=Anopheles darlingi TaxID=43151 RepID=A0A2M4CLB8_ANODA